MIRIGILGDIGSGKTFIAGKFGFPVFDADKEVAILYKKNKKIFNKLNKILPNFFHSFPINKYQVMNAILADKKNLKKIIKIVHAEIRIKMNIFLKKNKGKKFIILDIPLLLENKLHKKKDILIFIKSNKFNILKKLKKRKNYNEKLIKIFKKIQLSLDFKEKKSQFVIKNDFRNKSVKTQIRSILEKINK